MKKVIVLIITLLGYGCDSNTALPASSHINKGTSTIVPVGLVEWCNTLDTPSFYAEPECLWYCRVYSQNGLMHKKLIRTAKAKVTTCESY